MKKLTFLFVVILTASQFVFTSCDDDDDETINSLYGSWVRDHSQQLRITFTFNPDLTGKIEDIDPNTNNVIESDDFIYTYTDNEITLNDWEEVMRYRVSGNTLSLEEETESGNFREYTKL